MTLAITTAIATRIGGRDANADAAFAHLTEDGRLGAALIDGIGSSPIVVEYATIAATVAARVGSHRSALAGLLAASDTYPNGHGVPNAVGAIVTVDDVGWIDIAHVGDCAVWTWRTDTGLTRWTLDHTVGSQAAYMGLETGAVLDRLDDYVQTTLRDATVSTVATGLIRGHETPDLVVITSDGIHKVVAADVIGAVLATKPDDPQLLADALADAADPHGDNATALVVAITREDQ
ncbi:hypothetical protein [Alloactinosynnema sp. L-07]|uniref:hypothetical protein n=1 Tax=Alloactinosynnema sp. L-07 TaxID=1653480 RepID=UPI00065F0AB3|nr:hypothetical protein [Alloactinosynnema sp. L-07]CRK59048.1 hypothetical protein [Alloactinosynnema sp. L-07]